MRLIEEIILFFSSVKYSVLEVQIIFCSFLPRRERRQWNKSSKVPRVRSSREIFDPLLLERRLMSAAQSRKAVKRGLINVTRYSRFYDNIT